MKYFSCLNSSLLVMCSMALIAAGCGDDGAPPSDAGGDAGPAECGDMDLEGDELCDDGNTADGDGCSANCASLERCGNGYLDAPIGEFCDDGNSVNGDGCSADCSSDESCGNSVVDLGVGEVCDDGNTDDGDGCSADCMTGPTCGDGTANGGELCDDGNTVGGDGCSADCSSDETCGNTVTDAGEECDDGNTDADDGCSATCTIERCGNSLTEGTEACDDGNSTNGDGCDNDCAFSCTVDTECNDSEACTGVETCDVGSHTCTNPADLADGTSCGGGNVCNGGACVASSCGNSMTDGGEDCDDGNVTNGDGCDNDCTYSCTAASDCDDGDLCNGAEACNTTSHQCQAGSTASDGTACDRDMMAGTRDICLSAICSASTCGDGFLDTAAIPAEVCDDGNLTAGDGCEPDCTITSTGTGPTAFRAVSLDLMHPHLYANVFFRCRDITDTVPIGSSVNETLQESVDDYTLNYITVHRPLDIAMATNPVDFVEGVCTAGATMGDPPTCQEGALGTTVSYIGTNTPAGGMPCYDPEMPRQYNYTPPNTTSGPCFLTDKHDFLISVSGVLIPLQDARVAATYAGGVPPNQLVSGVIIGFLSEADARTAIIPSTVTAIGGDPLYEHLADGGATDSACTMNDDSAMYMGQNGFWFILNFTSTVADWRGL
ncbi:MAG: hypothetical protein JRH11_00490 [Deltaproteobacteria bacterium]|nr:hypothetical protein [Deltaproteobacteria bacterium]